MAGPAGGWVVETSGREWAAERVERTRAISNRTTIATFDAAHRHPRQPVAALVDPRLEATRAVLTRAPVGVADVTALLRSHAGGDGGWTVCMHVPGVEQTTAAVVAELPADGRPLARFLLGSPCTSVFVPLYVGRPVGEPVAWERFASLHDEHRPALDDLEASLARDAADDASWSREAWRRVDLGLRGLGV